MKNTWIRPARVRTRRRAPLALMLALGLVGALLPFSPASADHECTVTTPDRSVSEGGSIGLSATATGCNTVNWDLDSDGAYDDATGTTATFSAAGMDGPGSRTISVRGFTMLRVCEIDPDTGKPVCHFEEDVSTDSATVTINNAPPSGVFRAQDRVDEGSPYHPSWAELTDPYPGDAPFRFGFACRVSESLQITFTNGRTCPTNDDGTVNPRGTVWDKDNGSVSGSKPVIVSNVPPTASFVAPDSVEEGTSIEISLTDPFDPSSVDTAAGFQYAFDCGEGFGALSATSSASCPTTDDGVVLVTAKILDKDGGQRLYSKSVTVGNVAPTADGLVAPAFVRAGRALTLSLPGGTDVSPVDATSLTYAFDCGTGTFGAAVDSSSTRCSAGSAAAKVFRGKVIDEDGDETSYADIVVVDGAKPTGRVKINRGARRTRTRRVALKLSATDPAPASGVAKMRFSNNGRRWSKWQRYATAKKWRLTRGKGTKTVYVQFQDRVGITSAKFKDRIRFRP